LNEEAVTVVVPTRNRPDLLALTLTSILRQRDVNLQVIVVDDASTEPTAAMVSRFGDSRIRMARQSVRQGVSAARNRGVSEATTEWVAFCDDDDLWSPDKLSRQLASARSQRRDWAYAGCVFVDAELEVRGGSPPLPPEALSAALFRYNALPAGASNVVMRKSVLDRVGGFDHRLTHLPDWDLWLRLVRDSIPAWVNEPLVGYRIHAGNASFRTIEMLGELHGFARRHGLTKTRAPFHRHLAHLCLRAGRRREAVSHFLHALLHFRDGYSRIELSTDGRIVRAHAAEIIRRRLRRPLSPRAVQRLEAARKHDPNAAWKAAATVWLRELRP
jgi:glycosyltransferase involved in cell wall biosynthesis